MKSENQTKPKRQLSSHFTNDTLRLAATARRRADRLSTVKDMVTMKKQFNILRQPAIGMAALAVVVLGGAGAYAAANWFSGSIGVTSNESLISVDLSECDVRLPGISESADQKNVQFKITGTPHISEQDLQRKLLAKCEMQTIFGNNAAADGNLVGVIKSMNVPRGIATIEIPFGGTTTTTTIQVDPAASIYDRGRTARLSDFKDGDYVAFQYQTDGSIVENGGPFEKVLVITHLFKTQYDLREVAGKENPLYGAPNNIEPLY